MKYALTQYELERRQSDYITQYYLDRRRNHRYRVAPLRSEGIVEFVAAVDELEAAQIAARRLGIDAAGGYQAGPDGAVYVYGAEGFESYAFEVRLS